MSANGINVKELQAINKQVEELGWLNEVEDKWIKK